MEPFKNILNFNPKPYTSQCNRGRNSSECGMYSQKPTNPYQNPYSGKENHNMNKAQAKDSLLCPYVSAKSWVIVSSETGNVLFGKNYTDKREMASLTKIMTCYTALSLAKRWDLNLNEETISVSRSAAFINGTRAELKFGEKLSAWDVLHGMMLPSGNDAAICIAEHFGQLIYRNSCPREGFPVPITKFPMKYFINEMNVNAKLLGLLNTHFANPHGLANTNNKSTAEDIAKLASVAMKNPKFRQIVSCKHYYCDAVNLKGDVKFYEWTNTNKLLWEGFSGVKTGITPHAGPCLAACYEKDETGLMIILLNSKSMDARWTETHNLVKWAVKKLKDSKIY